MSVPHKALARKIAKAHPHLNGGGLDLPTMQPLFDGTSRAWA
jgi:hypothetical protein